MKDKFCFPMQWCMFILEHSTVLIHTQFYNFEEAYLCMWLSKQVKHFLSIASYLVVQLQLQLILALHIGTELDLLLPVLKNDQESNTEVPDNDVSDQDQDNAQNRSILELAIVQPHLFYLYFYMKGSTSFDRTRDEFDGNEVALISKLLQLQFPQVNGMNIIMYIARCMFIILTVCCWRYAADPDDVAEVMENTLTAISCDPDGPSNAFTLIYQSGLISETLWQKQVEEAIQDLPDKFEQQVQLQLH